METKICSKCKVEQELCFFQKDKTKKDGYRPDCKSCRKKYSDLNYHRFSERVSKYKKEDRLKNPEKYKLRDKNNRIKNPEKFKEKRRKYYENNKDKNLAYFIKKRNTDEIFKLKDNVRRRMNIFLSTNNMGKKNSTFDIIGCSPEYLREHLEKQFSDGMSWENYGFYGWHIDHKIPLSSAKTEQEVYNLCHYTNLQPLWAKDNLSKGGKIISN
jgi:hypothetical protein